MYYVDNLKTTGVDTRTSKKSLYNHVYGVAVV